MTKIKAEATKLARLCPLCDQPVNHDHVLYEESLPSKLTPSIFSARRMPDKIHYQYLLCPHDGLVFASPTFSEEYINELYNQSDVNYQPEIPLLTKNYLNFLQPVLKKLESTANIVEVGAGDGFMVSELHRLGFTKTKGVEPSRDAVNKASTKIKKHLIQKPFSLSLFKPDSLDLIFLFQTFDHLYDPNQFLENCYKLLKTGGYLVSLHHDFEALPRQLLSRNHPIIDIEHPALYTTRTTTAMWQKHGFLVNSVTKPASELSLAHLSWLLPLPKNLKLITKNNSWLTEKNLKLKLGNLLAIARKPSLPLDTSLGSISTHEKLSSFPLPKLSTVQKKLRRDLLSYLYKAGLSHIGSCLTVIDIIWQVYKNKNSQDIFILSNGHAAFAWYTVLAELGKLKKRQVPKLQVHPNRSFSPEIKASTGSLGQGLPIAVGMALADRNKNVYCLISDGEATEGSIWEALNFVAKNNLSNLKLLVSANGWSAYDKVNTQKLLQKVEGFGFQTRVIDGHNESELKSGFEFLNGNNLRCLFCLTRSDQLPFLEGLQAHYLSMTKQQYQQARKIFAK